MPERTVLIIDDDESLLRMLRTAFQRYKFRVLHASDGAHGLELARQNIGKIDLAMLSVELPTGNGFLVCKEFKQDPELKPIPVILTSRKATDADFEKHRKLKVRADDYLHKPFTDEELFQKVGNVIGFALSADEYTQLEAKVHDFLEERGRLEAEIREKADRISQLETELAQLKKESKAAKGKSDEGDELRATVERLERELKEADGDAQKARSEAEKAAAALDEANAALKDAKAAHAEAEAAHAAQRDEFAEEQKAHRELLEELRQEREQLKTEQDRHQKTKSTLDETRIELKDLKERVKGLEKDRERFAELEKRYAELEAEKERLDANAAALQATVGELERAGGVAASELQRLILDWKDQSEKVPGLEQDKSRLEDELEAAVATQTELRQRLRERLQKALAELD